MNSGPRRFDQLSWTNAANAAQKSGSTVVWPFGACEQHGPHLPLATDTFFAEQLANEVINLLPRDFPIWYLPSQSIGFSPEHSSFQGTISISAGVLLQLVMEVGEQLATMGFSRLVLLNAHGGQIGLLEAAARQLRHKCPSMAVLPCFIWRGVDALKELIPLEEQIIGLHAGLAETSLMLAYAPELVGPERPFEGGNVSYDQNLDSLPEGWSLEGSAPFAWLAEDLTSSGVIGDTRDASPSLGRALRKVLVDHWVKLFTNLMESDWPKIGLKKNFE